MPDLSFVGYTPQYRQLIHFKSYFYMSQRLRPAQPGIYRICVQGILGVHWSDYFGGMQITTHYQPDPPETILYGPLTDQAALQGVLTALYDMGFDLLDVEIDDGEDCTHWGGSATSS